MSVGMVTMYMKWKRTSTTMTAPRWMALCTLMFHISRSFLVRSDLFAYRGQRTPIKSSKRCILAQITAYCPVPTALGPPPRGLAYGVDFINTSTTTNFRTENTWMQLWKNPCGCPATSTRSLTILLREDRYSILPICILATLTHGTKTQHKRTRSDTWIEVVNRM